MRNQSNQYQSNFWPNFQSSAFHKGKPQNQLSCLVIGGRQVFPSLCQSQYTDKKVWNFSTPLQLASWMLQIYFLPFSFLRQSLMDKRWELFIISVFHSTLRLAVFCRQSYNWSVNVKNWHQNTDIKGQISIILIINYEVDVASVSPFTNNSTRGWWFVKGLNYSKHLPH